MNVKLLLAFSIFVHQFIFSQTEKRIKGIISSEDFTLQNIDIINITTKQATKTNQNGEFVIAVKENDSLYFYAKEYYLQKLKVSSKQIDSNSLIIKMFKKPEELEEVVITQIAPLNLRLSKAYEQGERDKIAAKKSDEVSRTRIMYDGHIDNGMDIFALGGKLIHLFTKEKDPKKEAPPAIEFSKLAHKTCDEKFFIQTLKLKPEEIELFLQFCNADPQSINLKKNSNILSMMDFLSLKNIEFQKQKQIEK